jgi:hypothetical protein
MRQDFMCLLQPAAATASAVAGAAAAAVSGNSTADIAAVATHRHDKTKLGGKGSRYS